MAQVYAFTDANGETRLFAEIHPDPAGTPFNGGTITAPLGINTDPGDVTLVVASAVGQTTDVADFQGTGNTVQLLLDGGISAGLTNAQTSDGFYMGLSNAATVNALNVAQNFAPFATVWRVNKAGYMGVSPHAAPADGDVATGECMVWFDQTNGVGATKLMLKGKSADGTVKTAAIVLT